MRAFAAVMAADVRERTRRPVYLVVLLAAVALAYLAVPAPDSSWHIFQLGDYRGVYNSAWVGTVTALAGAVWLSLAGFYVARGGIARDEVTGVGEVLATTPLGKTAYLLGKFASNLLVLVSMVVVLVVAALAMQMWRGESRTVDLLALLMPFVLIAVPVLAVTAAAAVLFETVSALRAGIGNLLWVVVWMVGVIAIQSTQGPFDALGLGVLTDSMQASLTTAIGDARPVDFGVGLVERDNPLTAFDWPGTSFGADFLLSQALVVGIAIVLPLVGAMWFNRFDPSRNRGTRRSGTAVEAGATTADLRPVVPSTPAAVPTAPAVQDLTPVGYAPTWLRLVPAEVRILTSGMSRWWWVGAASLSVVAAVVPAENVSAVALPLVWVWPVVVWSRLGTQPGEHDIEDLLGACPGRWRRLAATLLAGTLLSIAISAVVALRLLVVGDLSGLTAWAAGVLLVPALAYCLGLLTRSPRPFQVLYLLVWYTVLNGAAELDFMGAVRYNGVLAGPSPLLVTTIGAGLVALAMVITQLRHAHR